MLEEVSLRLPTRQWPKMQSSNIRRSSRYADLVRCMLFGRTRLGHRGGEYELAALRTFIRRLLEHRTAQTNRIPSQGCLK